LAAEFSRKAIKRRRGGNPASCTFGTSNGTAVKV